MKSRSVNELSDTADSASWSSKQRLDEKFEVHWSKCGNEEFNISRTKINLCVPVSDPDDKFSPKLSNSLHPDYS